MCYGPDWALQLFAYLEEGSLNTLAKAALDDPNEEQRANPMDTWDMQPKGNRRWADFHLSVSESMICPSSGTSPAPIGVPYNDGDDDTSGMSLGHLSKANYVVCFGGNTMLNAVPPESRNPENPDPGYAGMFGMVRIAKYPIGARLGKGYSVAKVTDGMSNTVMMSEILTWNEPNDQGASVTDAVGQGNDDWRGVWMIPGMGASAFSGKFPPNSTGRQPDFRGGPAIESRDQIPACGTGLDPAKSPLHADHIDIPCQENAESSNTWASARSAHNEGVNAAMGDGSVAFIADDVEARVWHGLCTRAGEEVVSQ
jgi:prepilin-type processing-associated H-X9-DG protein